MSIEITFFILQISSSLGYRSVSQSALKSFLKKKSIRTQYACLYFKLITNCYVFFFISNWFKKKIPSGMPFGKNKNKDRMTVSSRLGTNLWRTAKGSSSRILKKISKFWSLTLARPKSLPYRYPLKAPLVKNCLIVEYDAIIFFRNQQLGLPISI